jgi:hypothetical protein
VPVLLVAALFSRGVSTADATKYRSGGNPTSSRIIVVK